MHGYWIRWLCRWFRWLLKLGIAKLACILMRRWGFSFGHLNCRCLWGILTMTRQQLGVLLFYCETSSPLGWIAAVTYSLGSLLPLSLSFLTSLLLLLREYQTCYCYRVFALVAFSFQDTLLHVADPFWSFTS